MRDNTKLSKWTKVQCHKWNDEIKYSKVVYKCMLIEVENNPNHCSWAPSVRNLLQSLGFNDAWLFQGLGFNDAWLFQGVGNENDFIKI